MAELSMMHTVLLVLSVVRHAFGKLKLLPEGHLWGPRIRREVEERNRIGIEGINAAAGEDVIETPTVNVSTTIPSFQSTFYSQESRGH